MNAVAKLWLMFIFLVGLPTIIFFILPDDTLARNVIAYRDTISDSAPSAPANHTFGFTLDTSVAPGGRLEITPPLGFEILATTTFGVRNVELVVNGSPRTASTTASSGIDQVEITPGSPGFIRYTLAPDFSIADGSDIEIKIGNHTTGALDYSQTYSSSTGTTTTPADVEPIINSAVLGMHQVKFEIWDGDLTATANFVIFLNERIEMPSIDTTEETPPFRFNPAPTSTVGGTTLNVEISLETDELAICRFSTTAGVDYFSMINTFTNTGLIFHSVVVPVTPGTLQTFYVRCIDDEANFNIDDFLIQFSVNKEPTGDANEDGDEDGDGTGTGDDGSGNGDGSGGSGGGGGRGNDTGDTAGGGFESDDAPYRSGDARVIISGFAFPNSTVAVLVDGKVAETTRSSNSGTYSVTLDAIARGVYTFGVYGEGPDKVKSSTFSTSFTVTGARTSELTNINVSPSIKVTPDPVQPGQTLIVNGYGLPNSVITIQNGKARTSIMSETTVSADSSGRWSTTFNTSNFSRSTYQIRAKSVQSGGASTNFSAYTYYGVGEAAVASNADLNRDGKVNLTDFSILLFWWNSNGGDSDPPADINQDGRVTLTDFSILLFNWTG